MIKVIDNFLSDTESSMVEKSLSDCPWFLTYEEATVAPHKYLTMKDNNGNVVSNQYSFLINFLKNKLIENVKVNKFLRMKVNLQTQCSFSKEDFYNTPHLDRLDELKYFNAIYYVNDSDGDTFFFQKESNKYLITDKVSPKKGRLVVFDGDKYHSGRHPKESLKRVIINFNFL
jgi:hypothetical protein